MCERFGWTEAKRFQVDSGICQMEGVNLLVHVGTGSGKTAVVAAPFALPQNQKKITIFVSPLMALESEMAKTFSEKHHVPAVVINGTLSPSKLTQVIRDILDLKYQIILILPESLLSHWVREELLTNKKFKKHVLAVVIDKVHCVSFWSISFRKKYGLLHLVWSYLPKNVPFIGLSATLSPRVLRDITGRLHMPKDYRTINLGNEQPEVSIIVHRIKFPLVSCKDLAFVIDTNVYHPLDILKTFIYVDSKAEGYCIICFLTSMLPVHL
ncbi:hypothetical protein FS749_005737 [Ceratobasidium sp. UAMH 11750]|nr:hypothetical protein FS749_005737 [Ceratobasidium sp. UAMH 11750]